MKNFNESEYLALYPDVASAVKAGAFKSGYEHYQKHGKFEGWQPDGLSRRERAVFHLIDKHDLMDLLAHNGFSKVDVAFDAVYHPNGPSFCLYCEK